MKQALNKHSIWCWKVKLERVAPEIYKEKEIMTIGIDVYHAAKKYIDQKKIFSQKRSIGAFVSVNFTANGMTHTSQVIDVLAGKELLLSEENSSDSQSISESETALFQKEAPLETRDDALKQFVLKTCKEMGMNPSCVIVYRDGVGDGQLDIVVCTVFKTHPKKLLILKYI